MRELAGVGASRTPRDAREREVVALLRARDEGGLRLLLEDVGARVVWWLRREFGRALDDDDIDEAVATGAHRAWRAIDTFDPERGTLRAWFYVICRNAALKGLERQRRGPEVVHLTSWDDVAGPAGGALGHGAAAAPRDARDASYASTLRACIAELSPLQRAVIEADLASTDEVAPADELAAELGTTTNSIYNARSLARARLARRMTELGHPRREQQGRGRSGRG